MLTIICPLSDCDFSCPDNPYTAESRAQLSLSVPPEVKNISSYLKDFLFGIQKNEYKRKNVYSVFLIFEVIENCENCIAIGQ